MTELQNFIDGDWVAPDRALPGQLCDANTGEVLASQLGSSNKQLEAVLESASAAHEDGRWASVPALERAALLERVADYLEQSAAGIARADSQQTGVVISLTEKFALVCAGAFRGAAGLLREDNTETWLPGPHGDLLLERLPLGVAAVIAPWNAPSGIACHKLASALAAGCPTILKPSEWAPGSAQLIARAVVETGLPAGVFSLLHGAGDTGGLLVVDERTAAVSFTGGLQGGRAVAHACAEGVKPAQLELGGNNPLVVLADANLDAAADGVVTALTTLNGQWCRALGRLLLHESVEAELLAKIAERMQGLRIGSSLDHESDMGPLVHQGHRQHVVEAVDRYEAMGARIERYGDLPELAGWFVQPSLVHGLNPTLTLDEIFGPVATVHTFADDEQAIVLANQTPFGLAAYVFGEETHAWAVARRVRAGMTKINGVTMLNLNPQAPRPAWGLSGLGDEGTRETFEFFRGSRLIGTAGRPD
ncbi:MAG: aldehyde dehydrogenase family protein [Halieaceae bacterium]